MSFYADTSVLVAAIVQEVGTQRVRAWLLRQAPGTVVISDWVHTEVASALALKIRTGEITREARSAALAVWQQLHTANLPTLGVLPEHFESAARFAGHHALGLRAGDALHLAIAADGGHTLATLDNRLATAALELGIQIEPL